MEEALRLRTIEVVVGPRIARIGHQHNVLRRHVQHLEDGQQQARVLHSRHAVIRHQNDAVRALDRLEGYLVELRGRVGHEQLVTHPELVEKRAKMVCRDVVRQLRTARSGEDVDSGRPSSERLPHNFAIGDGIMRGQVGDRAW